jgi:hypothetical protein
MWIGLGVEMYVHETNAQSIGAAIPYTSFKSCHESTLWMACSERAWKLFEHLICIGNA